MTNSHLNGRLPKKDVNQQPEKPFHMMFPKTKELSKRFQNQMVNYKKKIENLIVFNGFFTYTSQFTDVKKSDLQLVSTNNNKKERRQSLAVPRPKTSSHDHKAGGLAINSATTGKNQFMNLYPNEIPWLNSKHYFIR